MLVRDGKGGLKDFGLPVARCFCGCSADGKEAVGDAGRFTGGGGESAHHGRGLTAVPGCGPRRPKDERTRGAEVLTRAPGTPSEGGSSQEEERREGQRSSGGSGEVDHHGRGEDTVMPAVNRERAGERVVAVMLDGAERRGTSGRVDRQPERLPDEEAIFEEGAAVAASCLTFPRPRASRSDRFERGTLSLLPELSDEDESLAGPRGGRERNSTGSCRAHSHHGVMCEACIMAVGKEKQERRRETSVDVSYMW
jgi:hypothetical protein